MACHVGPVLVKGMADKMREAGLQVQTEGTEHVYVDIEADSPTGASVQITRALVGKHGTSFGVEPRYLPWR